MGLLVEEGLAAQPGGLVGEAHAGAAGDLAGVGAERPDEAGERFGLGAFEPCACDEGDGLVVEAADVEQRVGEAQVEQVADAPGDGGLFGREALQGAQPADAINGPVSGCPGPSRPMAAISPGPIASEKMAARGASPTSAIPSEMAMA